MKHHDLDIEHKRKKLERAKKLFEELYDRPDNPSEVLRELEREIEDCNELQKKENRISIKLNLAELTYVSNFGGGQGKEKELGKNNQGIKILKELIYNKKPLHWSSGFILFRAWQAKVPKNDPNRQFHSMMRRLNSLLGFKKEDALQCIEEDKSGNIFFWKFNPQIDFTCPDYNKAIELLDNSKDFNLIKKHITEAWRYYCDSPTIWQKIVTLCNKNSEEFNKDTDLNMLLSKLCSVIQDRIDDLNVAIKKLSQPLEKDEWKKAKYNEARMFIIDFIQEKSGINALRMMAESYLNNEKVPSDYRRCCELIALLDGLKGHDENLIGAVLKTKEFKEVFNIVAKIYAKRVLHDPKTDYKKIEGELTLCLWRFINDKKDTIEAKSLKALKSYLIKTLYLNMRSNLIENEYHIEKSKQRDVWKVLRLKERLGKKSEAILNEDLCKLLKWDRNRLYDSLENIERLKGLIDIDDEYRYSEKIDKNMNTDYKKFVSSVMR